MERDATHGWQRPLSKNVQRHDYGVRALVRTIKKKPKSSLCPWPAGIAWFHVATSMLAGFCQNCQRLRWHLNSGGYCYCRIMSVPWHGAVYRGGSEYHQQKAQEDASGNRLAWNEEDAGVEEGCRSTFLRPWAVFWGNNFPEGLSHTTTSWPRSGTSPFIYNSQRKTWASSLFLRPTGQDWPKKWALSCPKSR